MFEGTLTTVKLFYYYLNSCKRVTRHAASPLKASEYLFTALFRL